MPKNVIIACDFKDKSTTLEFLKKFEGHQLYVKVGMELFYAEGPSIVEEIKKLNHQIFLDLKLCDIPNTVYKAMRNLAALDIDMVNVHAFGTVEMMAAAKKGLIEGAKNEVPKLIAVTQLTSTSQEQMEEQLLIKENLAQVVEHYAQLAKRAELDGVVCSPLEAKLIHEQCGSEFLTVTPGIRFANSDVQDQKRVTTPAMAREIGSDYIVVGRPITAAQDPVAAYLEVVKDFMVEN